MKKVHCTAGLGLVIFTLLAQSALADITKVVNAASFTSNNTFSAGTLITIKGTNLTDTTAAALDFTTPTASLGKVSLKIDGIASVLFYVSPTQVNAQIPDTIALGVKSLSLSSPTGTFTTQIEIVKAGSPGIFSLAGTGTRDGAVLNAVTFKPGPFSVTTLGQPTYLAIYATGLDLTTKPTVTVDGVSLLVVYAGPAPGFIGLQQINVKLLDQLAGAGRVEMMIATANGKTTNVVEIVLLPSQGQVLSGQVRENESRSRELAAIAWIPGTSLALLTDENDDVVRVLDITARKVLKTIALPEGAEPAAVAVDPAGKIGIVAERGRNKIAVLDLTNLTNLKVSGEWALDFGLTTASGPSAVSIVGGAAFVLNQDTDSVSIFSLNTKTVTGLFDVGRAPRGISSNSVGGGPLQAFITNQSDGTISVVGVLGLPVGTLTLGVDTRPQSILALPGLAIAAVTEPSRHEGGRVILVDLKTGAILAEVDVNPDRSGGSSEIAFFNNTLYFNNQSGGSVTAAKLNLSTSPPSLSLPPQTIKVGIGARAMAIDELDKLLLVTSEGSGEVVLIDLTTNKIAGRINGIRGEMEGDDKEDLDDHNDRDRASNAPVISSLTPTGGSAGKTYDVTIAGKNFTGATNVVFVDPASLPGEGNGRGKGNSGEHGNGPFGKPDPAFSVSGLKATDTQVTLKVTIATDAKKGGRVVRVLTPNGESTLVISASNTFTVGD